MDPLAEEKLAFVWLFAHKLHLLPRSIIREICLYLAFSRVLLGFRGTSLYVYTLPSAKPRCISLPVSFSEGTRSCWVTPTQVLFIGGGSYLSDQAAVSDTYQLGIRHYLVERLHSMFVPRYSPGVLAVGGVAYVFGGHAAGTALLTCEKFAVSLMDWEVMATMRHPRHSFAPVLYLDKIYLPDISKHHGVVEVYSPAENQFSVVRVELPTNCSNSTSFRVDDKLYVVSCKRFIWSWKFGTKETGYNRCALTQSALSSGPVEIVKMKAYWVEFHTGELVCLDLADLQGPWTDSL